MAKGNDSPCHYCTDRHTNCWSNCEKYKVFRQKITETNERMRKVRNFDSFVIKKHKLER